VRKITLWMALIAVTVMVAFVPVAMADTTIVVSPGNLNGWSYTDFGTTASQSFVLGPDTPPLGFGSAAFTHAGPAGVNGGTLHTRNFDGVYLRDITELTYWTYQEGADGLLFQPPYVQIFLDLDDDGAVDDGIGFEPSWQNGNRFMVTSLQGTAVTGNTNVEQNGLGSTGAGVAANQWWEWNLLIGSWWARFGGALSVGSGPADQLGAFECNQFVGGCATIAAIVQAYPNAKIISQNGTGGVRLQYGFGGNSHEFIGHVDKLVFGTASEITTYDFEPLVNTPPDCSVAVPSVDVIWPPNHKFVRIDILGVTDPDGDPVAITIDGIFQDEPVDTFGDGNFTPDGLGIGTSTAQVRAERAGAKKVPGNGRVYHIFFTADDGLGGTCTDEVLVGVPHDVNDTPIDDGALFDSTIP